MLFTGAFQHVGRLTLSSSCTSPNWQNPNWIIPTKYIGGVLHSRPQTCKRSNPTGDWQKCLSCQQHIKLWWGSALAQKSLRRASLNYSVCFSPALPHLASCFFLAATLYHTFPRPVFLFPPPSSWIHRASGLSSCSYCIGTRTSQTPMLNGGTGGGNPIFNKNKNSAFYRHSALQHTGDSLLFCPPRNNKHSKTNSPWSAMKIGYVDSMYLVFTNTLTLLGIMVIDCVLTEWAIWFHSGLVNVVSHFIVCL